MPLLANFLGSYSFEISPKPCVQNRKGPSEKCVIDSIVSECSKVDLILFFFSNNFHCQNRG